MSPYAILEENPAFQEPLDYKGPKETLLAAIIGRIEAIQNATSPTEAEGKILISQPLQAALAEILAAAQNKDWDLLYQLAAVKRYICSEPVEGEPFWELRGDEKQTASLYRLLDQISFAVSMALSFTPHGMTVISAAVPGGQIEVGSKPELDAPEETSPTLDLMEARENHYRQKAA